MHYVLRSMRLPHQCLTSRLATNGVVKQLLWSDKKPLVHKRLTSACHGRKVGTSLHWLLERVTVTGFEMLRFRDALSPRAPRRRQMHVLRIQGELKSYLWPRNEGLHLEM